MIYRKVCVPLMQINSNIYGFLSGIYVSLSTNIFTTLSFAPKNSLCQWPGYVSTLLFLAAGALCMIISFKVVVFQNYITTKQIKQQTEKSEIIVDVTEKQKKMWVIYYYLLFFFLIAGFVMLSLNVVISNEVVQPQ